jgi:hypothetical protein
MRSGEFVFQDGCVRGVAVPAGEFSSQCAASRLPLVSAFHAARPSHDPSVLRTIGEATWLM